LDAGIDVADARRAMTRADLHRLAGRFVVMLGGEVLQSLFHLGLNLALVRALSAHGYGLFAIVFGLGAVTLTFVRALAGVPALTFIPPARSERRARAEAVAFGTGALALCLGLALGTAAAFAPFVGTGALAAGAFVAAWSLRSFLRNLLFARGRADVAGLSDLAFTLGGTAMLAPVLMRGGADALLWDSLWLLAAAHALGLAVALLALRERMRIAPRHAWRRYRRLWRSLAWSVAGTATANVQAQGQMLLIAGLAGPAAYAPIAAVLVLFSPLRLLGTVVVNLCQPEMARLIAAGEARRLRRVLAAATALLAAACLAYGAGLALLFDAVEHRLFADRFADEPLGLIAGLVGATVLLTMLYAAPKTLIETRRAFPELAAMALASATLGMAGVAALVAFASPAWSMAGVAVSEVVVLAWSWRAALRPATQPVAPRLSAFRIALPPSRRVP
jgi:O-antigen/teichoic acid export membrane protein